MTTLGFVGAGKIGGTLARLAAQLGYDVVVSNSRAPETLAELVTEIGPKARAAWAAEASAAADVAIVSIPLKNIWQVDPAPLAGKIVLETNNYYPARNGRIAALDEERATTTGLLQEHLPGSHVVKAFNHINWLHLPKPGCTSRSRDCPPVIRTAVPWRSQATTPTRGTSRAASTTSSATTRSTSGRSPEAGASSATLPDTARGSRPRSSRPRCREPNAPRFIPEGREACER